MGYFDTSRLIEYWHIILKFPSIRDFEFIGQHIVKNKYYLHKKTHFSFFTFTMGKDDISRSIISKRSSTTLCATTHDIIIIIKNVSSPYLNMPLFRISLRLNQFITISSRTRSYTRYLYKRFSTNHRRPALSTHLYDLFDLENARPFSAFACSRACARIFYYQCK